MWSKFICSNSENSSMINQKSKQELKLQHLQHRDWIISSYWNEKLGCWFPSYQDCRIQERANNYKIPVLNSNIWSCTASERGAECKNTLQNLYNIWVKYSKNNFLAKRCAVVRNLYEEVCCTFSHSLFAGQSCKKFVDYKEGFRWVGGGRYVVIVVLWWWLHWSMDAACCSAADRAAVLQ